MFQPEEGQRVIVVAVDGSPTADNAFNWYLKNLKQPNDFVYGIVVPEYNFKHVAAVKLVGPLADVDALTNDFKAQCQVVEKLCSDYTAKLRSVGVKGTFDQISGDKPGFTICDQAQKRKADAIVIGTRGHSKFKRFLLGSVSSFVIHHSGRPCMVIPLTQKEEEEEEEKSQQKKS